MLPLRYLSLYNTPSSLPLHPISLTNRVLQTYPISEVLVPGNGLFMKKKKTHPHHNSSSSSCIVYAAEKDSQQFEIDPDKAREALKNLDQQLQSRSQKQVRSPKKKVAAPDVSFSRDRTEDEEVQEFSSSFFTITAVFVFAFTIFYNVLFYTVIKPSIDGP